MIKAYYDKTTRAISKAILFLKGTLPTDKVVAVTPLKDKKGNVYKLIFTVMMDEQPVLMELKSLEFIDWEDWDKH